MPFCIKYATCGKSETFYFLLSLTIRFCFVFFKGKQYKTCTVLSYMVLKFQFDIYFTTVTKIYVCFAKAQQTVDDHHSY